MTEKINKRFLKKELNAWLRLHKQWNHHDWSSLLDKLTKRGFHQWSVSVAGQKEIGFYLETNRR
ncbi:uncharacterized protein METZ01_LOCUS157634 [marine metagenome]|uniref:Uncharacterized protein n=1 Tax=marine metagenome TaxID=408172 RepID=A0A382ATA6_9ZZZZ